MHLTFLAIALATSPNAADTPIVATPVTTTMNASATDQSSASKPLVAVAAPSKTRRAAWEPPGIALDADYIASLVQAQVRTGDGGG